MVQLFGTCVATCSEEDQLFCRLLLRQMTLRTRRRATNLTGRQPWLPKRWGRETDGYDARRSVRSPLAPQPGHRKAHASTRRRRRVRGCETCWLAGMPRYGRRGRRGRSDPTVLNLVGPGWMALSIIVSYKIYGCKLHSHTSLPVDLATKFT
eukprot:SAG31_NODE_13543_length_862_cov_1.836173_1_plen_152_part_00